MKKLTVLFAASALAMIFSGCKQQGDTSDADIKAIKDTEAQWVKDYASKDPAKLAAYYTDDAYVIMSGTSPSGDKDTILANLKKMTSDPAFSVTFHSNEVNVSKSGDIGYSRGKYATTMTDPITKAMIQDHGEYLTVYAKQADGKWKATEDVVASEVAPPRTISSPSPSGPVKAFHPKPFD